MTFTMSCNYGHLRANRTYRVSEVGSDWVKIGNLFVPSNLEKEAHQPRNRRESRNRRK